ncbi:hypothetical protein BH10ACT4_BH10ACT4_12710 [soil metagenome]
MLAASGVALLLALCAIVAGLISRKLLKVAGAVFDFRWSLGGVVAGSIGVLLAEPGFVISIAASLLT